MLAGDDKNSVLCEVGLDDRREITYSPYGHSAGGMGALGHNGEVREAHVGWYLLGNGYRAFNPGLMRFHSPDGRSPFAAGWINTYAYCGGDPVNFTDPTGQVFGLGRLSKFFSRLFGRTSKTGAKAATSAPVSQGGIHDPRRALYDWQTGFEFNRRFQNSNWQLDGALARPTSGGKPAGKLPSGFDSEIASRPSSTSSSVKNQRALSSFDFLDDMPSSANTGYIDHSTQGQMPLPESVSAQRSLPAPVKHAPKVVKAQPHTSSTRQQARADQRRIREQQINEQRAKDRKNGERW